MPANGRNYSERVLNPSEANRHLVDDVFVVGIGFIRHAPSGIDELNLTIFNMALDKVSLGLVSIIPPSVQEGNFNDGELVGWIVGELAHHRVDGILHTCPLC